MIIFLYGKDTFRSKQKLHELKEKFLREVDPSGMNLIEFDAEKVTLDDFHGAVSAVSFLARKRMVILREYVAKNASKTVLLDMLDALQKLGEALDTIIVFWEQEVTSTHALAKFLKAQKYAYVFAPLKAHQIRQWIIERVQVLKGTIEPSALDFLSDWAGKDLFILENELQKLVAYAQGRMIQVQDIKLLTPAHSDEVIFHFIDALCQRNVKQALKLFHDQLALGMHELYVLSMIIRQFRLLLQLKLYLQKSPGYPKSSVLAKMFGVHPYIIQKSLPQAQRFQLEELKNGYQRLMVLDGQLKTTRTSPQILMDMLFSEICIPLSSKK